MDDFVRVMFEGAIVREHLAHNMYMRMADAAASSYLKELFFKLAEEELMHEKLLKSTDLSGLKVINKMPLKRLNLLEGLEKKKMFSQDITDINEALNFAIAEEEKDYSQYDSMVKHMDFGSSKDSFEELARQEARHKVALMKVKIDFNGKDWRLINK